MNHSKPFTSRVPVSHITAYASVVHGSRKKPISGSSQLSYALDSMSLKMAMKTSAKRGDSRASSAIRQGMSAI